jgi:hypothetical protein
MNEELCWAVCQKCWSSLSAELGASTSFGRADAVRMLQAVLQVMLQGAGPVGYYLKVLKGVVSAGYYTYRAFWSWVLVLESSFLDVLFLGVSCSWSSGPGHCAY